MAYVLGSLTQTARFLSSWLVMTPKPAEVAHAETNGKHGGSNKDEQ